MNKRILNILLIFLIIIIWGGVLRKFFPGEEKSTQGQTKIIGEDVSIQIKRKDSLKLNIVNANPFAMETSRESKNEIVRSSKKLIPVVSQKVKIEVPWPKISYHGFVQNENSRYKLILLKVDGSLIRLKENEIYEEMQISAVNKDSIVIKRKNQTRIYKKFR